MSPKTLLRPKYLPYPILLKYRLNHLYLPYLTYHLRQTCRCCHPYLKYRFPLMYLKCRLRQTCRYFPK
jgi:hypothetical protein